MTDLIVLFLTFLDQLSVVGLPLPNLRLRQRHRHHVRERHRCGRRTGHPDVYQDQGFDHRACRQGTSTLTPSGTEIDMLFVTLGTQSWYLTETLIQRPLIFRFSTWPDEAKEISNHNIHTQKFIIIYI